ncbi:DNA gyrase/topoisomerase IV, A subunit [Teladorsagia circumcincta]|uniref:DNA topoisomerase (ATP-hydrolyzing) n=1 Tax=Teladorsagia circumcincta TaxID=45464 RepID=A0A2G9UGT2_TELCI|nr:DNA gyrase/topoisomerase IV, A subunit [Teladorsagia circumcincta]
MICGFVLYLISVDRMTGNNGSLSGWRQLTRRTEVASLVAYVLAELRVRRIWENADDTPLTNDITYKEFVDNDLFRYSLLDLRRSIPSVVDGLKPSQRKVIHTLLRRSSNKEIKVNQLAAAVALNEAYHHGETSLVTTIVRLAQNFVGMNNVCLLEPLGQFGTRHEGGDDAASARYIYTKLTPFTRLIFPSADDELLHYLEEENQLIEPEWCRHSRIFPELYKKSTKTDLKFWLQRIPYGETGAIRCRVKQGVLHEMSTTERTLRRADESFQIIVDDLN